MSLLHTISLILHVLTACVWIGSLAATVVVVLPALRATCTPQQTRLILQEAGTRLSTVALWSLAAFTVTGLVNFQQRVGFERLVIPEFWGTPFGRLFAVKMGFVTITFVVSTLHALDARRDAEPTTGSPRTERVGAQTRARVLGRSMLMLSLVVLALGVMLVRS